MIHMSSARWLGRSALLLLLVFTPALIAPVAAHPPDSTNALQGFVPDSIALDSQVVFVDFWASWCIPCRHSFPWLQSLYSEYHVRGLQVIGISVDKDHRAALRFLAEHPVSFPVLFDSTGALAKKFDLAAMPTSFLYGRDGRLALRREGFHEEEVPVVDSAVTTLLGEAKLK